MSKNPYPFPGQVGKTGVISVIVQLPGRFANRILDTDTLARAAAVAEAEIIMLIPPGQTS